jgi:ADP-ribose pyrophosphatase YjhB (NUDIX family)
MIVRRCAGGVVFYGNKVLLLRNDKGEWVLPKGKISESELATQTAINKVKEEAAVKANILGSAGETVYEFFSRSRQSKVCNAIIWYVMESQNTEYEINKEKGFLDGGFFKIKDALNILTHNNDKSIVEISFQRYKSLKKSA